MIGGARGTANHGRVQGGPGLPSGAAKSQGAAPSRANGTVIRLRPHWLVKAGGRRRPLEVIERDVKMLRLIADGLTLDEAADQLGIPRKTVESALVKTRHRSGARTRVQLFVMLAKAGVLD